MLTILGKTRQLGICRRIFDEDRVRFEGDLAPEFSSFLPVALPRQHTQLKQSLDTSPGIAGLLH